VTESFLHYLWELQYFNKESLQTTSGESILILHPGHRNLHAGPDFFNARVKIGAMEWVGSVEIHIQASGWAEHRHSGDKVYENVILHVVWNDDRPARREDGSLLPALELKNRVAEGLLLHYRRLLNSPEEIPCAAKLGEVSALIKRSMLDKVLMERLDSKAEDALTAYRRNNNDWQETCFQVLAQNFGFKVNGEPFQQLAKSVPYKVMLKHADKLLHVEALLFGQAGFLEDEGEEEYYRLLQREYTLLSKKYSLQARRMNKVQWRFLRLRPANFPTIRIAQLAAVIHARRNLFSALLNIDDVDSLREFFSAAQSDYWLHHYHFFKQAKEMVNGLGTDSVENIIVNTVATILVAYGKSKHEEVYIDRAVCILQGLKGESNNITRLWKTLGMRALSAFDSQAMVELHNNYCLKRRCLDCNIGGSLVNPRIL